MKIMRLLACTAAAGLLLGGCAGKPANAPSTPTSANEIVIGAAGPMTGDLAAFGEQILNGAEDAVAAINAKGGVLGKPLRLVVGDDQCDPRRAVRAAHQLVDEGAVFVDGHFCSGSSIPASEIYAEAGILQISPASTNPALTDEAARDGVSTVMRVANRDDQQGLFAGKWLAATYAARRLAIVDDGSAYGGGVADTAEAAAKAAGLEPVLRQSYSQRTKDFTALVGALAAARADVVYIGGYHDDIGLIVRQARERGFKGDFVAPDSLNTAEFWRMAGSAGEGVRFTDATSATELPSAREAVSKFRSRGYEPEGYTLNSYAAVQAFAAAAAATASTEGAVLAAWLRKNTVPTVIGDLAWDAKGDLVQQRMGWYVWRDGGIREDLD
jgi:branched-chain amino acid transport system substrate-binding protein